MQSHVSNVPARSRHMLLSMTCATALTLSAMNAAQASEYDIETVTEGLVHPWAISFVPDTRMMLVTERPGNLHVIDRDSGEIAQIDGVPDVHARGQGGLLDLALHPDFPQENWLYMTWSGANEEGLSTTYMGRARLDLDNRNLSDLETLYTVEPYLDSNAHYGSRIVFDHEGYVYFSTGDRNSKDFGPQHYSQDRSNALGAILRLNADGSIPDDNPFVDDPDAQDAIFSFGHRNPQGMAVHPQTGEIWENEHGENNGDEINVIQAGGNFGWPIATWGVDYNTGERFAPTPPEVAETIDPVYYWESDHPEGFPPSGMAFYFGEAFPEWEGDILMGNLPHRFLGRFSVDGHEVEQVGRLLDGQGWRIRDVAVAPDDGFIYVIADDSDAPLLRLRPPH
jgi:glucose/arabinose dehydrogenase